METLITQSATEAAEVIKAGGIVAFPTETVFGLGANIFDESAVGRIYEAKGRPADNPLIAHISTWDQIGLLATEISESAGKFIEAFFPGALTVVLRKMDCVPTIATAGLDTIGIRMPKLAIANRFLRLSGVPVVAPSANLSGRPSPTTWKAVREDLNGRIDCILRGDGCEIGLESSVVDCTGDVPVLLRAGSISLEHLRLVVPETRGFAADAGDVPRSPGLRHKHYSPLAKVVLVKNGDSIPDSENAAFIGINNPITGFRSKRICESSDVYARSIFEFFRECDRAGIDTIYCEAVGEAGIGAALMDRLRRASEN